MNKLERNCISNVTFGACHYDEKRTKSFGDICSPPTGNGNGKSNSSFLRMHICISNWWFNNIITHLETDGEHALQHNLHLCTQLIAGQSININDMSLSAVFFSLEICRTENNYINEFNFCTDATRTGQHRHKSVSRTLCNESNGQQQVEKSSCRKTKTDLNCFLWLVVHTSINNMFFSSQMELIRIDTM